MYSNIFKILKYIVYGTIVYLFFCYVPSNELSVNDITIIMHNYYYYIYYYIYMI